MIPITAGALGLLLSKRRKCSSRDFAPSTGGPYDPLMQALAISTRSNERLSAQMQGLMATVTGSIDQIGKGYAQLGQLLSERIGLAEQRAIKAEELRDLALQANMSLQNQVAEARAGGQGWITLREIYAEKPELLHDGIKDLATGIFAALRNALTNSEG